MKQEIAAFAAGLVFGLGLIVSRMIDPAKVLAFLDVAGAWDPSLALVMGSALGVAAIGYRVVLGRPKPVWAERFHLPTKKHLDAPLLAGSALFGIGWGLVGLCPGPALTDLTIAPRPILAFVAAMAAGMILARMVGTGGVIHRHPGVERA